MCRSAEFLKGFGAEGGDGVSRIDSSRNGTPAPAMAGSIEEVLETAAVVGFPGGLGGTIHREE